MIDILRGNPRALLARVARGHRQQKQILEQCNCIDVGLAQRQCEHRRVERAALDIVDQLPGLGFPQLQPQVRKHRLQHRENARQQIGRQRWNHPER